MTRRQKRRAEERIGDTDDPSSMAAWLGTYLEWLRVKNYSERTVENRQAYLSFLIEWCAARSVTRPQEVTRPLLERYQRYLFHFRKPNGKPLSFGSQFARLVPVRHFFRWLVRQNALFWNPASDLDLPRMEKRLPKHVLTTAEAEAVLGQPNTVDPFGLRDRAMLETLYSTGMRRMELIGLSVFDLDTERGTVMIRQGKGKKDRMVPIGERAILWIEKYIREARPGLVAGQDEGALFLTQDGERLSRYRLTEIVREYVKAAEIGKSGACHLFRHTMATVMLENGADIRFIQEMLGHAELSTTQIYTQVSIRKLKAVHTLTHPTAKLRRECERHDAGDGTSSESDATCTEVPSLAAKSGDDDDAIDAE
jgi:integrase/recombinase XerD